MHKYTHIYIVSNKPHDTDTLGVVKKYKTNGILKGLQIPCKKKNIKRGSFPQF